MSDLLRYIRLAQQKNYMNSEELECFLADLMGAYVWKRESKLAEYLLNSDLKSFKYMCNKMITEGNNIWESLSETKY